MKKNNSLFIIVGLILVLALAASISLVQNSQELRRGAYFAGTKVLFNPVNYTATVGQEISVPIYVETQPVYGSTEPSKVDFVETRVCYGRELRIDVPTMEGSSLQDALVLDRQISPAFTEVMYTRLVQPQSGTNYHGCLEFAVRSDLPREQLKSGMVRVAMVKFRAMSAGTGNITFDTSRTTVSGYNSVDPGNVDQTLKVEEFVHATYTIAGQTKYDRGTCNTTTGNYACTVAENGAYATLTECENSEGCEPVVPPTSTPRPTNTPQPSPTVTPGVATNPVLKFRFSYMGVRTDSQCAVGWPVQIIVLGPGGTKVYTDVPAQRDTSITDKVVYRVTKVLDGFSGSQNIAVFVKGRKHLQMKYAKNNQNAAYDRAGGELTLTNDANTTPDYDFTNYPMLAGDVTGPTYERQDGVVDGRDFSYVKTRAIQRISCNPGEDMLADLDGNCQVVSVDISTLMLSLAEKQGQLY